MAGIPLGRARAPALIGDLAFVPLTGAAILLAWRASRRADLGPSTCRAWRLFSVALSLYLLGDLLQLVYEAALHRRAYPTWADAAYLSFYPGPGPRDRSSPHSARPAGAAAAPRRTRPPPGALRHADSPR